MTQRQALRLSLAAITVGAAGASAAAGNFWIAGAMVVFALATVVLPLTKRVLPEDVKKLLEVLRDSQHEGGPAVLAVVGSKVIFVHKAAIYGGSIRGNALLFRDEMTAAIWRELATLLRHQTHASPELKTDHNGASPRLGKSSDL